MATAKPAESSPRSNVTSITSILERSVPPTSSFDRLSFKSVTKDYGSGKDKESLHPMLVCGQV